jgi:hypothetical protein
MKQDRENAGDARPLPRRRPGEKPFIPFVGFEDVVARCGHVEKFGLLPEGKDRFREDRRKKAIGRDCKACREQKQRQEQEAAARRRSEKEKVQEAEGARRSGKAPGPPSDRLPDGSQFEVRYDAGKVQWSGSLTVPTAEGGASLTFTGSASALFALLRRLDKLYRATLK